VFVQCVWYIVAAVLELGQVEYEPKHDGNARIKNYDLIQKLSKVSRSKAGENEPVVNYLSRILFIATSYL